MKNMQPPNQRVLQQKIDLRMRTMRTLWIAMLLSVGFYFLFTLFLHRPEHARPNGMLSIILAVMSFSAILISLPLKSRLLNRAVEQQQVSLVQQGYILAWAVTEVAALMGLLDFFATNDRYYYIFFLIAGCGELLNFPKREHVENASFKSSIA